MTDVLDKLDSRRKRISEWINYGEDVLYLVTGLLLAVTAVWLLIQTGLVFFSGLRSGDILGSVITILDRLLLVLMLVELIHTIRVSIGEHALVPQPFLIVALIAAVRRVLILTAEASRFIQEDPELFRNVLLELGLMSVFFLVITFSLVWLRKHGIERA